MISWLWSDFFDHLYSQRQLLANSNDPEFGSDSQLGSFVTSSGDALELHSQHYITNRSLGNRIEIPGLMVPCGLLKITNDTGVTAEVQVHLCPGDHRGYLAAPMQDM